MLRLLTFTTVSLCAVSAKQIITEAECSDSLCQNCVQLNNITTGTCYDDPQETDLFVVAACDSTRLVEMFYSDDQCANAAGKEQNAVAQCIGPDLNKNYHIRQCVGVADDLSFEKATTAYTKVENPMVKYSFTFTGDGDNNQAPKFGCFEQDNGCEMCIQAWWNYPPDASYKYAPIVARGCQNATLQECDFCPPGLTFYQ